MVFSILLQRNSTLFIALPRTDSGADSHAGAGESSYRRGGRYSMWRLSRVVAMKIPMASRFSRRERSSIATSLASSPYCARWVVRITTRTDPSGPATMLV